MITVTRETTVESSRRDPLTEREYEKWNHWPIHWSGVWVGALAAFAAALLVGFVAIGVGAQVLGPEHRIVDLKKITITAAAFGIFGAFLSFVIGGWASAKVSGILRSEPAMLQGAIAWLVAVPLFLAAAGLGAGGYTGGWYAGLTATPQAAPPFEKPATPDAAAWSEYEQNVSRWREETPKAVRNAAICAASSLLLGLIGSVVGGWMGSGEPMTFTLRDIACIRPDQTLKIGNRLSLGAEDAKSCTRLYCGLAHGFPTGAVDPAVAPRSGTIGARWDASLPGLESRVAVQE